MLSVQEAFKEIASLKHPLNKFEKDSLKHIEIIPLFEQVSTIIRSGEILEEYFKIHKKAFGFLPKNVRPFIARSDPALNSGIVPTVVAAKIALSNFKKIEKKYNIKLHPIIGVGSLPFRGGLSAVAVKDFVKEYKGIRTATIQSAFRYDYPIKQVKNAIAILEKQLPKQQALTLNEKEQEQLVKLIKYFEAPYQKSVTDLAPLINQVAAHIPRRRERVQHIGLFGYSRGVGKVRLPRAISFTASLYCLGVPPELIGTGRGLGKIIADGKAGLLKKAYTNLKLDLAKAGGFLSKVNLSKLAKLERTFKGIEEDVAQIEKYIGQSLGPKTTEQKQHVKLSEQLLKNLSAKKPLTSIIEKQAALRHSMG
jgi:phosphoenolpyruvate carboxylase